MTPRLLFSHVALGKHPEAIRRYLTSAGYAGVEWNLEAWRVMVARDARRRLLERFRSAASMCSVHAPYADLEIGHRDPELAAASLRILREYVDIAADLGAHHVNVHVGSFGLAPDERSWEGLVRNLTSLMEHAARRGTRVTVENLRRGLTSEPETFAALLRATAAPVTFDHGHAHGSAWVQEGHGTVLDVLRSIPTPVIAAHLYLTERDDTHVAPANPEEMAGALDLLRERGCDFWVLELLSREALEQTRRVVERYLAPEHPKTT
jgi:sugar phosphate isomerase/epimerase